MKTMFLLFKESKIVIDKTVHAIKYRKVIILGIKFSDRNITNVLIKDKNI